MFSFSKSFIIEKCSESTGIILVLFFFACWFKNFHPQIIDSLFAIKIFLLFLIICNVGSRPAIPGIDEIAISDLFLKPSHCLLGYTGTCM